MSASSLPVLFGGASGEDRWIRTVAMKYFRHLLRNNKGATAIEYGLIAALIAVAAVSAMSTLGNKIALVMLNSSNDMAVS